MFSVGCWGSSMSFGGLPAPLCGALPPLMPPLSTGTFLLVFGSIFYSCCERAFDLRGGIVSESEQSMVLGHSAAMKPSPYAIPSAETRDVAFHSFRCLH